MDKPKVGDKFWVVDCGNAARRGSGANREGTVTKVGRKFFTVEFSYRSDGDTSFTDSCAFNIKDRCQKTKYSAHKRLYESKKAYQCEIDTQRGYEKIRKFFDHYGKPRLTLLDINAILEILDIQEEEK